ncbi:hypothetical protein CERZMDRAFT_62755 [Cercospora zeae-maydis SCOH1-5]|uniref:Peptidase M20 domain-containing protein 2 n=1 Tax=Cercospora zeae-maydis SCOH1-5 TaxID=717836 RepID=A0A6A6F2C6_9PEZI|nr:hypothetical protein CERZMDRAFT_62755 [Cercospora zeae-maydis SCOH1-5]
MSEALRQVSLQIHDNPELQYREYLAHDIITKFVAGHPGWNVTRSAFSLATAFMAVFDSGRSGPVVSFNAEYDALKDIGHACGHNLIAMASIGAALATAEMIKLHTLHGKVVLFGCPAEEGGGGKIKLLEAGAFKGIDVSLISHPGISQNNALMRTSAYTSFKVEFFGKEAHAAARPWDGINALDALVTAYTSISALRQQTQPGDILQAQILNGGLRPNIIHAYASGRFVVRSETSARLEALKDRVLACFQGAATATGAEVVVTQKRGYSNHRPNRALGRSYRSAFNRLGGDIPAEDVDWLTALTMASTDQGDISHAVPSISPNFWIRSASGGPHTPDFEKASRTEEAHHLALRVGKALAATAVDVLTQPKFLQEVKREFGDGEAI